MGTWLCPLLSYCSFYAWIHWKYGVIINILAVDILHVSKIQNMQSIINAEKPKRTAYHTLLLIPLKIVCFCMECICAFSHLLCWISSPSPLHVHTIPVLIFLIQLLIAICAYMGTMITWWTNKWISWGAFSAKQRLWASQCCCLLILVDVLMS